MKEKPDNLEVTDFERDVIQRSRQIPVLVDFWAEWCGPCKILGPVLERLADTGNGRWVLAKLDTERHPDVAAQYAIRSIPNVKLFVDGTVAAEFVGALPEPMVRQWLQKHVPGPSRKVLNEAHALMQEGKTAEAQRILYGVVQQEPENNEARVLLARTLLFSDPKKALDLVVTIAEDSEHFDIADAMRTIGSLFERLTRPDLFAEADVKPAYLAAIRQLQEGNYDAALEKFIEVIRNNRYYDEDGSRKACIAVFRILGEEHPTTQKYRREFSRALY